MNRKDWIHKSPLITGEDKEGQEGLIALLSLRSSLSPIIQAQDEMYNWFGYFMDRKWGALVNAVNENGKGVVKGEPLEKLPAPAVK